jgi:hypothetical protein
VRSSVPIPGGPRRRAPRWIGPPLFYKTDNEHYAIHHDDPTSGEAWLEDGGNAGLTPAFIRWGWPELADAARLD